jgi:hypothetical protein
MGIRRLIADRDRPVTIYSDNGTNFLSADKELQEGVKNLNSRLVADEVIDQGISWSTSPPTGAHFNIVTERLVASAKTALCAVLNGRAVNDEVLLTVLKEVASLLNTRPITHVSTDPFEPEPLTLNNFILGCHHPHLPPNVEDAFHGASRKHWEQAQFIVGLLEINFGENGCVNTFRSSLRERSGIRKPEKCGLAIGS